MNHDKISMHPDLQELQEIVVTTAREELLPRFAKTSVDRKLDGSLVTEADIAMQRQLGAALMTRWPKYEFLGEELSAAEQARLLDTPNEGLWCLDPLDGTSNFAAGIPYFATSLALLVGGEAILGLVYDPHRDECFTAEKGRGAWLNGEPLGSRHYKRTLSEGIGLIDFKRLPSELAAKLVHKPPYSSQRSFGSSALDWCWIASDRCHVYLHGRQMLWDYAAGRLILEEAGGHSVTFEGEAVLRPELRPRSVAAALSEELFREWVAWLGIQVN
ncbi:inositol monophosphatase [Pseudomonas asiatica]|nr:MULTISPECIES: inositol monophosphatase [Pseudomonas]WDM87363.1 inositol monophosphatase [Pseudomonas asiatica]